MDTIDWQELNKDTDKPLSIPRDCVIDSLSVARDRAINERKPMKTTTLTECNFPLSVHHVAWNLRTESR